ncbi:hypothetical protein [Adlercreutzia caecimuris]|uniref:hypothetical protein n=1 Tax=Adlercreutzia caecimuris TaxID=671266 RepID=UPI002729A1EB|nr:hypothetical protein [Adlercreutzia caecimuris]
MTLDEATEILLEGTPDQIRGMEGSGAWYRYSEKSRSLTIGLGGTERRMHKLAGPPACAAALGPSHRFSNA